MGFERWGYQFDGAFIDPSSLKSSSGVYVIWCKTSDDWTVLDGGEAGNVRDRVMNHDRSDYWQRHCSGTIYYSATYTPYLSQTERVKIEQQIMVIAKPPCGER